MENDLLKWEVGPVVVPKEWDYAAASMRPPASPSCRLALRAGSHRGLGLRPGGKSELWWKVKRKRLGVEGGSEQAQRSKLKAQRKG